MKPIILICGEAGSGKDTVASLISKHCKAISIAQADPMKRLGKSVFGFTDDQLWGPSESRNASDDRYRFPKTWDDASWRLQVHGLDWVKELGFGVAEFERLETWFTWLAEQHGVQLLKGKVAVSLPSKLLTPRFMLQTIGTEWGRSVSTDVWSKYALKLANTLLQGGKGCDRAVGTWTDSTVGIPDLVLVTDGRFPNEVLNAAGSNCHRLLVVNPQPADDQAKVQAAGVANHQSEAFLKQIPGHWYTAAIYNDKTRGLEYLEEQVASYVRSITQRDSF